MAGGAAVEGAAPLRRRSRQRRISVEGLAGSLQKALALSKTRRWNHYSANGKLSCPTARMSNTFSVIATKA
jgi:hypothetical protein